MSAVRVVCCSDPECLEPATYKIASQWSSGRFRELKTYGFTCDSHIRDMLRSAEIRWLSYEPVPGEAVHEIGIYRYEFGKRDGELERYRDVEELMRP